MNKLGQLYALENKTSDEVLAINGFEHINQLIPYINKLRIEKDILQQRIDKAIKILDTGVFYTEDENIETITNRVNEKHKEISKLLKYTPSITNGEVIKDGHGDIVFVDYEE